MELLSSVDWDKYRKAINDASDTFNQETIIWHRLQRRMARDGEEDVETFLNTEIKGLIAYNYFKSWPDSDFKVSGENEDTSVVLILNKKYLNDRDYLNANGYFAFNPGYDYFTIKGIEYDTKGDTDVAQANDDPLMVYLRLERKQLSTGKKYHE